MKLKWRKVDSFSCVAECGLAWAETLDRTHDYRAAAYVTVLLPTGRHGTIHEYRYGFATLPEAKKAAEQLLRGMVAGLAEQVAKIKEQME